MSSEPEVQFYVDLKKCSKLPTIKERQKCKANNLRKYKTAIVRTQWHTVKRRNCPGNNSNTSMPRKDHT